MCSCVPSDLTAPSNGALMGGATGLVPAVWVGPSGVPLRLPLGPGWFTGQEHTPSPGSHRWVFCRPVPVRTRPFWGIDFFIPGRKFMSSPGAQAAWCLSSLRRHQQRPNASALLRSASHIISGPAFCSCRGQAASALPAGLPPPRLRACSLSFPPYHPDSRAGEKTNISPGVN